jgi:hypothetical protein
MKRALTRRFGKEYYGYLCSHAAKVDANRKAQELRSKGCKVRVIPCMRKDLCMESPTGELWGIWWRNKELPVDGYTSNIGERKI